MASASDIQRLVNSNIEKVKSLEFVLGILNCNNNLFRFDLINRIAIQLQNANAFELRSENGWRIKGRKVISNARSVDILVPRYKNILVDSETDEEVDKTLSKEEIDTGLNHEIIRRKNVFSGYYAEPMYDVTNTSSRSDGDYKVTHVNPQIALVFDVVNQISGITVMIDNDGETRYSKKRKWLFMPEGTYDEMISTINEYLAEYLSSDENYGECDDAIKQIYENLNESEKDFLKIAIHYSLNSLYNIVDTSKVREGYEFIKDEDAEDVITLLNLVNIQCLNVIYYLSESGALGEIELEDSSKIDYIKKIEQIHGLMILSYIQSKMQ